VKKQNVKFSPLGVFNKYFQFVLKKKKKKKNADTPRGAQKRLKPKEQPRKKKKKRAPKIKKPQTPMVF